MTGAFPELTRAALQQIQQRQVILDGEAVAYDPATGRSLPFQETAQRRRTHAVQTAAERAPIRDFAFDLPTLDGQDTMQQPQSERSQRLADVVHEEPNGALAVTPHVTIADTAALERYFSAMVEQGNEGAMAKPPDAPYQAGVRSFAWVKLKREYQTGLADTFDVVIVGYFRGRGRRPRLGIGSLLCAVYDPAHDRCRAVTRVGSGLSDAGWVELRQSLDTDRIEERPPQVDAHITADVWTAPARVIELIADDISRSPLHTCGSVGRGPGYALRFPWGLSRAGGPASGGRDDRGRNSEPLPAAAVSLTVASTVRSQRQLCMATVAL